MIIILTKSKIMREGIMLMLGYDAQGASAVKRGSWGVQPVA